MSDLLHKLENNEQVLLMHLAGELPAQDSAEVQRMLATDAGLRSMLDALRELDRGTADRLAVADAGRDPAAEEASVRRTLREMRRHQLEQSLRPTIDEAPASPRRYPWWIYSGGGVAAAVVILLGLWGLNVIDVMNVKDGSGPMAHVEPQPEALPNDVVMAELVRSLGGSQRVSSAEDEANRHVEALQTEQEALALFGAM